MEVFGHLLFHTVWRKGAHGPSCGKQASVQDHESLFVAHGHKEKHPRWLRMKMGNNPPKIRSDSPHRLSCVRGPDLSPLNRRVDCKWGIEPMSAGISSVKHYNKNGLQSMERIPGEKKKKKNQSLQLNVIGSYL